MKIKALPAILVLAGFGSTLAACGGPGVPAGPAQSLQYRGSQSVRARGSWMASDAKSAALLYVSNSDADTVDVYKNFMSGGVTLEGQLTDFNYPYGNCVDRAGNVYITESYGVDVLEYAHGGTTRIKRLPLSGFPVGCAVDPTTGNLAVSVLEGSKGYNTPGGVFIFTNAAGTPAIIQDPHLWQIWPPAYDSHGNLYVLGYNPTVELVQIPHGGSAFRQITLKATLWAPGSVLWQGGYLYAVDQQYHGGNSTGIYRLAISGTHATILGTTVLTDPCSPGYTDVIQPLIQGGTIFGPDHYCNNEFAYWSYPRGGNPSQSMPANIAPLDGTGQAISPP